MMDEWIINEWVITNRCCDQWAIWAQWGILYYKISHSFILIPLHRFLEKYQSIIQIFSHPFSCLNARVLRCGSSWHCWNKGWCDRVNSSGERVSATNTNAARRYRGTASAYTDIHKPNPLLLRIMFNSHYSVTSVWNNRETTQSASSASAVRRFYETKERERERER
jgi:hypothetical protein